jgi:hypothetical protein
VPDVSKTPKRPWTTVWLNEEMVMPRRKGEPSDFPATPIDVKELKFGDWAICPKCHAKVRKVVCKRCLGIGVVPNQGPIPFLRNPGE